MLSRILALILLALPSALALAQGLADEDRDWGVPPQSSLKAFPYTAPTPRAVPGARLVRTEELRESLSGAGKPLLIDVLSGDAHITLGGALWWPGVGHGSSFFDPIQADFAARLNQATGGDRAAPLAFFCVNSRCWLSYNASLRAVALGYTHVLWYRGGVAAWLQAGLPMGRVRERWAAAGPLKPAGEAGKKP